MKINRKRNVRKRQIEKVPKMSQREVFARLSNLLTPEEKIIFGNFMEEQEKRKAALYD